LNDLQVRGRPKDKIVENLKKFNPRAKDYSIKIQDGTVHLFIREEGLEKPISAMRLSDGTLRYLCLLVILCHPEPPPLICIEEPETGLHPDILPTIAELMIEASQRTQLIVTTHSDILVSAFSERPEAVLVCEKDEDGTHFKRLEKDKLKAWLEEYELGDLWLKGEIGVSVGKWKSNSTSKAAKACTNWRRLNCSKASMRFLEI
jgi:predicted ATPase